MFVKVIDLDAFG